MQSITSKASFGVLLCLINLTITKTGISFNSLVCVYVCAALTILLSKSGVAYCVPSSATQMQRLLTPDSAH